MHKSMASGAVVADGAFCLAVDAVKPGFSSLMSSESCDIERLSFTDSTSRGGSKRENHGIIHVENSYFFR